jgi:hypothetical protein
VRIGLTIESNNLKYSLCEKYPKVLWQDLKAKIDFLACAACLAFA